MQHDLLGKTKSMIIWLYISRRKIWEVEAESKKEIFDRGLRVQHDHWFQHYNVTELATIWEDYRRVTFGKYKSVTELATIWSLIPTLQCDWTSY
jgi:hypothetical protein